MANDRREIPGFGSSYRASQGQNTTNQDPYNDYWVRYRNALKAGATPYSPTPASPFNDRLEAEKAVDALATGMSPLEALNTQRQDLVEREYQNIVQKREEEARRNRESLTQSLNEQRRAFRQGRGVVSEDAFSRGRGLFQSLASRGLAGSGLQQLGDVQNRLATGQAISSLYGDFQAGQQAGVRAGQQIEQDLATALREAELGRTRGLLDIEQQDLAQQEAQQQRDVELSLQIGEILANPDIAPDVKQFYLNQLGSLLTPEQLAEVQETAPTGLSGLAEGLGGARLDRDFFFRGGETLGERLLNTTRNIASVNPITAPAMQLLDFAFGTRGTADPRTGRTVEGDPQELLNYYQNVYKSDPNYDDRVKLVLGGTLGRDIRFEVTLPDGTKFKAKTYDEALSRLE